jgi:type IV pilus assembly protein PilX
MRTLPCRYANTQRGAALLTALVFLVLLTMLVLSSMNTNIMEERMAANSQEVNRAFQAAETGIETVMDDSDAFQTTHLAALDDGVDDTYAKPPLVIPGGYGAEVTYNSIYREMTAPPRGSGWDSSMAYFHFDMQATATIASGATTTVHAGAYQVGRRP